MEMFETKNMTLWGLFKKSEKFTVPKFQRSYVWGPTEWDDFIETILDSIDRNVMSFFGPMYLVNDKKNTYIVDGQQRIITYFIILSGLKKVLNEIGDTSGYISDLEFIMGYKNGAKSKLEFLKSDYIDFVGNEPSFMEVKLNSDFQKAFRFFYNYCVDLYHDKGQYYLYSLYNTLKHNCFVTVSYLDSLDNALELFESINSTGVSLTPSELIKNMVLIHIKEDKNIEVFNKKWDAIYNKLDKKIDSSFHYFWFIFNGYTQKYKVHREIRTHIKNINQEDELVEFLEKYFDYANIYNEYLLGKSNMWGDFFTEVEMVKNLRFNSLIPIILLCAKLEVPEFITMIFEIYFLYIHVLGRSNTFNKKMDIIIQKLVNERTLEMEFVYSLFEFNKKEVINEISKNLDDLELRPIAWPYLLEKYLEKKINVVDVPRTMKKISYVDFVKINQIGEEL